MCIEISVWSLTIVLVNSSPSWIGAVFKCSPLLFEFIWKDLWNEKSGVRKRTWWDLLPIRCFECEIRHREGVRSKNALNLKRKDYYTPPFVQNTHQIVLSRVPFKQRFRDQLILWRIGVDPSTIRGCCDCQYCKEDSMHYSYECKSVAATLKARFTSSILCLILNNQRCFSSNSQRFSGFVDVLCIGVHARSSRR